MRRVAAIAVIVVAVLAADARLTHAQFRGGLTSSRATAPVSVPRSPIAPLGVVPVWWQWPIGVPPEITTLAPAPLADDAPRGGLQLDVLPWSAQVYVDGTLAGQVEQFRGYYQHLDLPAGPHAIVIVAAGREPHVVDVLIVPGKTLTYRAALR